MIDRLFPLLVVTAKLMSRFGIRFPEFSKSMKLAFVQAAEASAGKPTDSEISVATGLQRRDVARLRKEPTVNAKVSSPLARLIYDWRSLPDYSTEAGPRVLSRSGDHPSFETLANSVVKDVHPRTLLDALVAAGSVEVSENKVKLLADSFQPAPASEAQIGYLTDNVSDHLSAALGNTLDETWFERAAHFDGLNARQIEELQTVFRDGQMAVLEDVAAKAAVLQNQNAPDQTLRFRAGGYFWAANEKEDNA